MCEPGWNPAYWLGTNYPKHHPDYGVPWKDVLASTKTGPRKYHHDLTLDDICKLEMSYAGQNMRLPSTLGHVAHWLVVDITREVVGADRGKETNIILVKRNKQGGVHGHPINLEAVRKYSKAAPDIKERLLKLKVPL